MQKSEILPLNEKTMQKYATFEQWAKVHLVVKDKKGKFKDKDGNLKAAFEQAKKNAETPA